MAAGVHFSEKDMALSMTAIDELRAYIRAVMERADHHAGNVNEIVLALAGAILWRKEDDDIKVMAHGQDTKNVLWVRIGGKRYAFSYVHATGTIEMRQDSTHGNVLHTFTNATALSDVKRIFEGL